MKNEIKIGDKSVTLVSNALTPFAYTEIFKKDFLRVLMSFNSLKDKKVEEYTDDDLAFVVSRASTFAEIAFVMAKQGEGKTAAELVGYNRGDFMTWLSEFDDTNAFMSGEVLSGVLATWQGQAVGTVESKNE